MEIFPILNSKFDAIAENSDVDLFPSVFAPELEQLNDKIVYNGINNGVYRCGFAKTQAAYDTAVNALFDTLDHVEDVLSTQPYLTGHAFTEADIRLFVTLIRFDEVYAVHFKTNKKLLREYPNLFNYTKAIYQRNGMAQTVNLTHIRQYYYGSHSDLNK